MNEHQRTFDASSGYPLTWCPIRHAWLDDRCVVPDGNPKTLVFEPYGSFRIQRSLKGKKIIPDKKKKKNRERNRQARKSRAKNR